MKQMSEADQLISRQLANPHDYLGAHQDNGSVVIRTFRPAASAGEKFPRLLPRKRTSTGRCRRWGSSVMAPECGP